MWNIQLKEKIISWGNKLTHYAQDKIKKRKEILLIKSKMDKISKKSNVICIPQNFESHPILLVFKKDIYIISLLTDPDHNDNTKVVMWFASNRNENNDIGIHTPIFSNNSFFLC